MKILGIDPGYERCGVAIIEKNQGTRETILFSTCIRTSAKDSMPERLRILGQELGQIIDIHQPEQSAIEALYFAKNTTTAMLVAEARGVIQYVIASKNVPCVEYHPNNIKIAIAGHGGATKNDIATMLPRLVVLDTDKKIDDELDAIAVALTHAAHIRFEHK